MTIGAPIWLALAVLALPIIFAFLRQPAPRPVVVASLLLYKALGGAESRRRRPPRDELLALALMLCALLAVIAALALRPDPAPRDLVVVLDNSASMNATVGDQTRFERAIEALESALAARPDSAVTLIATAPARIVADESVSRAALLEWARTMEVSGNDGDLAPLLSAACAVDEPPEVVFLSDGPGPAGLDCLETRPDLGPPLRNRGITEFRLRAVDGLGLVEAWVEVQSTAAGPVVVVLSAGEDELGRVTLAVDPAAEGRFRLMARAGRQITARLDGVDDWADDDIVHAVVPPALRVQTHLLTSNPTGYMAAALGAHPLVDLSIEGQAVPGELDLLVVESIPDGPLPAADHVVVLGVSVPGVPVGPASTDVGPLQWAEAEPLLRHVDLERLHVRQARVVPAPDGGTIVVWSPIGPLMVRSQALDGSQWLSTGFQIGETDLGLRVGMANWVANIVLWSQQADEVPGGDPDGVRSPRQTTAQPPATTESLSEAPSGSPVIWAVGVASMCLVVELFLPGAARRRT